MKNKKLLLAIVAFAAAIAIFAGVYMTTRPAVSEGSKAITVEVVHKDATSKTFEYQTDEEYLGALLLAEGLIEGEEGQYGLYVTKVDGEEAIYEVDNSYWAFYQNGEYAQQGVDTTPITDGDSYSLVYTIG